MPQIVMTSSTWLDVDGLTSAVRKGTATRLSKAALTVEREAKIILSKGGRKSPGRDSGGRFKKAVAGSSNPGEAPRLQTGNLRSSIQSQPTDLLTWVVGPTRVAFYGKFLEFGTRHIEPRPFMFPALLNTIPKFPTLFRRINFNPFMRAQSRLSRAGGRRIA